MQIVKKLKLTGTPYKIFKKTAFIQVWKQYSTMYFSGFPHFKNLILYLESVLYQYYTWACFFFIGDVQFHIRGHKVWRGKNSHCEWAARTSEEGSEDPWGGIQSYIWGQDPSEWWAVLIGWLIKLNILPS